MTLDTRMYVHDEADPRELFHFIRGLLGATSEHVYTDRDVSKFYGAGVWEIGNNIGQGLPALLEVKYRPGGALRSDATACTDYCYPEDDDHHHPPAHWCEVSMDTAYAYSDSYGDAGALHARLVFDIGQWLDERDVGWSWVNEFTGERWEGDDRYAKLGDLVSGGQAAMRWFKSTVEPVIAMTALGETRPS